MKYSSKVLEDVVDAFNTLPSVGKKTALRLVLHLIHDESGKKQKIIDALKNVKENLRTCEQCYNFSDEGICEICKSSTRSKNVVCVVESVRDVMAIEETQQYNGVYHVLGGVISPLNGIGHDQLNLEALLDRVKNGDVTEIIMALSPTVDGDTTIYYISKKLHDENVNISTIARGVSFGGELEYADEITLGRSILARTPYSLKEDS